MESDKLVDSLRMLCHQPGGKNNASPGPKVAVADCGTTLSMKSGNSCNFWEKTSTREVLLKVEWRSVASELGGVEKVYINSDTDGGASQTDLWPTT